MGFSDRDWGDTRRPRRRRRTTASDVDPLLAPVPWVGRQRVAAQFATDATIVDRVRGELAAHLDRHCEVNGYAVDPLTVHWDTCLVDPSGTMDVELRVMLVPRTDGVWGEIRIALAEDEADRRDAAEAAETVHDGLDRLSAAREWWLAHPPPKRSSAATAPSTPVSGPSPGDRPPSVLDVRDRDYTR